MKLDTWRIIGQTFHFGRQGFGQEETGIHVPSDSLFSALTACYALMDPTSLPEWMDLFMTRPPILVLSSAFPCIGEIRFFPTPTVRSRPEGIEKSQERPKDLKKIRFVSETIFRQLLDGVSLSELRAKGRLLQDGQFLLTPEELDSTPNKWKKQTSATKKSVYQIWRRPQVTVGRTLNRSALYHTGVVNWMPECGLWFAVRWQSLDPVWQQRFQETLHWLGDSGLGGERSRGLGKASFDPMPTLDLPDAGDGAWVSLSRYLPAPDETLALTWSQSSYTIEPVGGWMYSPGLKGERRRTIHMLSEGSVLGPTQSVVPGQIVDVQPNYQGTQPVGHPVWRNGHALAVGFKTV